MHINGYGWTPAPRREGYRMHSIRVRTPHNPGYVRVDWRLPPNCNVHRMFFAGVIKAYIVRRAQCVLGP